jgi:hypothetical protein
LKGCAAFSADGTIQRITSLESFDIISVEALCDSDVRPIWEQIGELTGSLSPEVFDALPRDGAKHHVNRQSNEFLVTGMLLV